MPHRMLHSIFAEYYTGSLLERLKQRHCSWSDVCMRYVCIGLKVELWTSSTKVVFSGLKLFHGPEKNNPTDSKEKILAWKI